MKILAAICLAATCLTAPAQTVSQPSALNPQLAIRAIIGEAAGEPFTTKLAIAGALRNRDSLAGVRGLRNARMIDAQPDWVWADARRAWSESATNDLTHGATHFDSVNFPTPYWAEGIKPVATVGVFRFWKLNPPVKTDLAVR
jgi:hypothetical protein